MAVCPVANLPRSRLREEQLEMCGGSSYRSREFANPALLWRRHEAARRQRGILSDERVAHDRPEHLDHACARRQCVARLLQERAPVDHKEAF